MDNKTLQAIEYSAISLPEKPCLVPWVTWRHLGDDRLQFQGADFAFTLLHPLFIGAFSKIHALLNGKNIVEEIASSGGEAIFPTTITFLLKILHSHGLLHESHPDLLSSENTPEKRQALYFSHIFQDFGKANDSFSKIRLGLLGEGPLVEEILSSLYSIGIKNIFLSNSSNLAKDIESKGIEFFIACHESPGFSYFEEINAICLEAGVRWMHVALEGARALMGPTMVPFQTACYKCYATRIDSLVPDLESHLAFKKNHNDSPRDEGYFPPLGST